ncbi:UNVERIFIED_CONTAM: hypothetical protein FKN15_069047 [Acipenser sinensis]
MYHTDNSPTSDWTIIMLQPGPPFNQRYGRHDPHQCASTQTDPATTGVVRGTVAL